MAGWPGYAYAALQLAASEVQQTAGAWTPEAEALGGLTGPEDELEAPAPASCQRIKQEAAGTGQSHADSH